jgi:hypothetical protein
MGFHSAVGDVEGPDSWGEPVGEKQETNSNGNIAFEAT